MGFVTQLDSLVMQNYAASNVSFDFICVTQTWQSRNERS